MLWGVNISGRVRRAYRRLRAAFPEHEIYVRSQGRVRFLRLTTNFQLRALLGTTAATLLWITLSGRVMLSHYELAQEQAVVSAKARSVQAASVQVENFAASMARKAQDIETRQNLMEHSLQHYFGAYPKMTTPKDTDRPGRAIASPAHITYLQHHLQQLELQQNAQAMRITRLAQSHIAQSKALMRRTAIGPEQLLRATPSMAMGGPYVPVSWLWPQERQATDPVSEMERSLDMLDQLERGILNIPAALPVREIHLSSGFGVRFDPFTHWPALHMGQDFAGYMGAPIYATGAGRVLQAGWSSGYGRLIILEHGHGLSTRYGHLARVQVRKGQWVRRGDIIGFMGSSGRSTGTHLHYELRLQSRAINPVYLMREMPDVLKVQKRIQQRLARAAAAA